MKRYDIVIRPTPAGAYWEAEPYLGGDWVRYEDAKAAIEAEREQCIQTCLDIWYEQESPISYGADLCAKAIEARSQK